MAKNTGQMLVKSFLDVLHDQKQDDLLPEVSRVLSDLTRKTIGEKQAVIWSVVPLNNAQTERIKNVIRRFIKDEPEISNKIDKNLLAGFRIEIGDWVFDASLKSEFIKLQKLLS